MSGGHHTGFVKWFNEDKGFGFITPEAGGRDIMVFARGIKEKGDKTLSEGGRGWYRVESGPKGNEAVDVQQEE